MSTQHTFKTRLWEWNPTLHGIFVSFLRSVVDAEATWYSLKPLGNKTPYIGDILGFSSENTFAYFNILGLCTQDKTNGNYSMRKQGLQDFYDKNMVQDCTQFTWFRNNESWILVGMKNNNNEILVPSLGLPPPRIPSLRRQGKFLDGLQKDLVTARQEGKDFAAVTPIKASSTGVFNSKSLEMPKNDPW